MYADKRQWKQFLSIFLLAAGVGFTVAGIIFFFAYNWEDLPKLAKLGIVQTLLVASVLLTVFTRWNILIKQIILTGATFQMCIRDSFYGWYSTPSGLWRTQQFPVDGTEADSSPAHIRRVASSMRGKSLPLPLHTLHACLPDECLGHGK